MNKENAAISRPDSSGQSKADASQKKTRPDLVARLNQMRAKQAAERVSSVERVGSPAEAANDNNRPPSAEETFLQQEAKRRRRIEMITEMTKVDEELEMQKGLDDQSEAYISQQLQTVDQAKQELKRLEEQQASMQGSFFKRTMGRLFGGEARLKTSLDNARLTYSDRMGLLEGAQDEYGRHKMETATLLKRSEGLHAEADALDKEIPTFTPSFKEGAQEVPKSLEETAREQLFEGMDAPELKEQQAALRSERTILQTSAKGFEASQKRLEAELQTLDQPLMIMRQQATQLGEFLRKINVEHENVIARLEGAQAQYQKLNASFWSRLVNKQEILTLERQMNEERVLLQGLDHHFMETQSSVMALNHSPEAQIAQKKQAELMGQLAKLRQKQELTQKRLLENDLLLTEAELAMKRVEFNRPTPRSVTEEGSTQQKRGRDIRNRVQVNRSNTSSADQRIAA